MKTIVKRLLVVVFLFASSVTMAMVAPETLIQDSIQDVMSHMKNAPRDLDKRVVFVGQKVDVAVIPHMDFVSMSKLAVGFHWKRLTDEQKEEIIQEFRTLLVRTYTKALAKFVDGEVEFVPYRKGPRPDRANVKTKVKHANGGTTLITYSMRLIKEEKWMVYDVKVENISLVTNYRTNFNKEIALGGADGLIKLLKEKNAKAESGKANE